jgi:hypothetical protein
MEYHPSISQNYLRVGGINHWRSTLPKLCYPCAKAFSATSLPTFFYCWGLMDIWNILAGVASILSLIFHLSGKGSGLKPLTFPITIGLVGFCIGRAGSDAGTIASQFFQDPYLMLIMSILILLFSLAMYLVESNKMDVRMSYIFLVFLATVALPYMLKFYGDISPNITTADYLVLAQVKENSGNAEDAIKYLKIYARRVGQKDIQKQIDSKVEELTKQKFKQDFRSPIKK